MGRTIKLILYYFAYQFAVAIPGMFGYTCLLYTSPSPRD